MPFYKIEEDGKDPRVVDADNPAAALKHAAQSRFTVSPPLKQAELVSLMTGGTKVEKAGEPTPSPTPAQSGGEAGGDKGGDA
jgi:hypothetical protein